MEQTNYTGKQLNITIILYVVLTLSSAYVLSLFIGESILFFPILLVLSAVIFFSVMTLVLKWVK